MIRDKDGKITDELKPEEAWDDEDDKLARGNYIFKLIKIALLLRMLGRS